MRSLLAVSSLSLLLLCLWLVPQATLFVFASPIGERQSSCPPLQLFHAAGTGENGLGIVGNALARSLPQQVSGAVVTAIDYDTRAEYFTTVRSGARTAATAIQAVASRCPNTKFAITGYSKGALVVHQISLPSNVQSRVVGVAVFGDPNNGRNSPVPINDSTCFFNYCNRRDQFCDRTGGYLTPHLAYPRDGSTDAAAQGIGNCYNRRA